MPNRESWQNAITDLDFNVKLELDKKLTPLVDGSLCRCTLNEGREDEHGFEVYNGKAGGEFEDGFLVESIAGDREHYFMLRALSSMGDIACVLIASCALQKGFGSVISYDGKKPKAYNDLEKDTLNALTEYFGSA